MLLAQEDSPLLIRFTLAPLLEDYGVPLAVMGVLVVFLALVLVVIFITLLPRVLPHAEPATSLDPTAEEELSEETLAVITAAVAATLDKPQRIVRIRGLTPADLGWSMEGRMQHHQSHTIPQRARR
jgi:sodium pump decarboxylase gamma subunit